MFHNIHLLQNPGGLPFGGWPSCRVELRSGWPRLGRRWWLLPLLAGCLANASGRTVLYGIETVPESGIQVEVVSYFDQVVGFGYLPLSVEIRNGSPQGGVWEAKVGVSRFSDLRVQETVRLAVPAGQQRTFPILVPMGLNLDSTSANFNGGYNIAIAGRGISPWGAVNDYASGDHDGLGWAFSAELARVNEPSLVPRGIASGRPPSPEITLVRFQPGFLPTDWRGYTGLAMLGMTDAEWVDLEVNARKAILDWVQLGGNLVLAIDPAVPLRLPGLDALGAGSRPTENSREPTRPAGVVRISDLEVGALPRAAHAMGLGRIALLERNGLEIPGISDAYLSPLRPWAALPLTYIGDHPWLARYEPLAIPAALLTAMIVIFAILVGPVNLLALGRRGQRHLVLLTIPVLSLGFALLLALMIVLQDGFGGEGQRAVFWLHQPASNQAAFVQFQVSRTGVLLGTRFEVSEPLALMIRAPEGRDQGRRGYTGWPSSDEPTSPVRLAAGEVGGSFFASRSLRLHTLEGVVPTRARLEWTHRAGEAPQVVSSLPHRLDTAFFVDLEGSWWRGENLDPGVATRLVSSSEAAFMAWKETATAVFPLSLKGRLDVLAQSRGMFFAYAGDVPGAATATLSAIRWEQTVTFHVGSLSFPGSTTSTNPPEIR